MRGRAGPRDIVLWEKAPVSLPTLSQARTLPWRGETSLQHELLPRRGSLRGFLCRLVFTPQQRLGAGCLPRHCRAPATFPGCYFSVWPGVQESSTPPGQRSPCRPTRAQSAFPASRNSFPVPTTAGTPNKWGTNHSRARNRKHRLEASRNCPVCCRPGGSAFFPRRGGSGSSNPSSIPRGPPQALPRCGPGSAMGGGK